MTAKETIEAAIARITDYLTRGDEVVHDFRGEVENLILCAFDEVDPLEVRSDLEKCTLAIKYLQCQLHERIEP